MQKAHERELVLQNERAQLVDCATPEARGRGLQVLFRDHALLLDVRLEEGRLQESLRRVGRFARATEQEVRGDLVEFCGRRARERRGAVCSAWLGSG